jgi:poly(3-hydroxybutyrate) depolymerase
LVWLTGYSLGGTMKMAMACLAQQPAMMSAYADGIDAVCAAFGESRPLIRMANGWQENVPAEED